MEKSKYKDLSAFEELIMPYEKLVYNISYRMLGNTEDAKDVSQEVWLKVYKNLSKRNDMDSFKAWVCTITNNACIDFLRKKKVRIKPDSIDVMYQTDEGEAIISIEDKKEATPEEVLISKERKKAIINAVGMLNPVHKAAIIFRDINGFSYEEIAAITSQNIGTVKSQISRARESLRTILLKMKEQEKI